MQRAVNPQTGEVVFLVNNQWVAPSQTARNPQTGELAYLVGNQWQVAPGQKQTAAADVIKSPEEMLTAPPEQAPAPVAPVVTPGGLQAGLVTEQLKSGTAGLQEGFYANAAKNNALLLNMMDRIDRGEKIRPIDDVLGYADMDEETRKKTRDAIQSAMTGTVAKTIAYGAERQGYKRNQNADLLINLADQGELGKAWEVFKQDPTGIIQQLSVESLPNALPSLIAGGAGLLLRGGVGGLMTGLASGSFPVEYVASITDSLRESGVDLKDAAAVEAKLRDPQFLEEAGKRAMTRGTVIAAADAASGRLLMPFKAGQAGKNVAKGVANIGTETGLEMAGEAAAQAASNEEIKLGQVLAEGLGAGPQAAVTTALRTVSEGAKPPEAEAPPAPRIEPTLAPAEAAPAAEPAAVTPPVAEVPAAEPTVEAAPAEAPLEGVYSTTNRRGKGITVDVKATPEGGVLAVSSDGKEFELDPFLMRGMSVPEAISVAFARKGAAPATLAAPKTEEIVAPVPVAEAKPTKPTVEVAEVVAEPAKEKKPKAPPKLTPPEGFKLKEGRNEQVVLAARQLEEKLAKATTEAQKNAAKAEYDKYVNYYSPIPTITSEQLEIPLSADELSKVLTLPKVKKDVAKIDAPIEDGTPVGLRMDIPALKESKKVGLRGSVVSVHEASDPSKKSAGNNLSYKSAGHITNPVMAIRSEEQAFDVAKSEEGRAGQKKPQQTIEGNWVNTPPDQIYARVQELMNDPSWTQVSLDPNRHSFFYDRKTKRPVISGSEAYQVGRFVLVKDAKFGNRNSFLYAQAEPRVNGNRQSVVKSLVDKVKAGWANAPKVEVVQSIEDLPADLQKQIKEDGVNPRGAYHPSTETVYIIADNVTGYRDSILTLVHEALGHFGLRSVLGGNYESTMNRLYETNREVRKLADKKIKGGLDKATAVEEVLAEAIEDRVPAETALGKAIQNIKNIVRQFLNKIGLKNLTDKEINSLLDSARDYVVEGRTEAVPGRVEGRAVFATKKPEGKRSKAGQAAMKTVEKLGRQEKVEPSMLEKANSIFKDAKENPSITKEAAKKNTKRFIDYIETKAFTSDAALNNQIRRTITDTTMSSEEQMGVLLSISSNQAVHADALASLFIQYGNIQYNPELYKYEAVDDPNNFVALSKAIDEIVAKHGLTKEEAERVGHTFFEARRLDGVMEYNERIDAEVFEAQDRLDKAIDDGDENAEKVAEQDLQRATAKYKYVHMTREDIDAGLTLIEKIPELQNVADIWNGIRQNTAKVLVDSGLWSQEEADVLLANIDYVPFYREDQLEKGKGPKEFLRGLQVPAKEKKFKGSDLPVADVFDNMVRWTQYAVKRSVMNNLAVAKVDAAVEFGFAIPVKEAKKGPNAVRVWRNGEAEFYDMEDPMYMEAFAGLESVALPVWKFFAAMSNFLRQSVVLYPLFSVAQVPQDAFAAMFSSGLKTRFALTIPARVVKEFITTVTKSSKVHEELKRFGAVGIKDFSAAIARQDAEVTAGLKKTPGIWNKAKGMLEHWSMASDNAVRQAVYSASISQGLTQAEAIEKAFAIINFRNRGSSKTIRMLGQVVPFFNAYMSAQHVAIKTISGIGISPTKRKDALATLITTTGTVAALSLIYAMAMDDDEEYKNKPSVMRDRLFIIPGTGMTIPIRTDIFSLPKILTEHAYMLITDQGAADGRKFRDSLKAALGNALFGPTPVPQAVKPIVEAIANYSFFQGRPLVGTFQKGLELERQFNDSTSEFAKLLGQTGMISPILADHFIRGMLGSVGGLFLYMTNPLIDSFQTVERPENSLRDLIASLPGTSGFVSKSYESGLKNDFYVLRDEVAKAVNTLNDIKRRTPQELEDFISKESKVNLVDLQKIVNQVTKELTDIRKDISVISNLPDADMSPKEKKKYIDELKKAEEELLRGIDVKELRKLGGI